MMPESKILGKKLRLRSTIFEKGSVSRQNLIKFTGLNERTVIRYADELKRQRLIYEKIDDTLRGRPKITYFSNSEKCCFLGIRLSAEKLFVTLVDINTYPIFVRNYSLSDCRTNQEIAARVFQMVGEVLREHSKYILGAAGIAYDITFNAKHSFPGLFAREFSRRYAHLQFEVHYNDDLFFWHFAQRTGVTGTLLGVVCGACFYMTLVSGGEITELKPGTMNHIRHFCVDETSRRKCSCGRTGCVNAEFSYDGVVERYHRYSSVPLCNNSRITVFNLIHHRALSGDKAAERTIEDYNRMLGMTLAEIERIERFDSVALMSNRRYEPSLIQKFYTAAAGTPAKPIMLCGSSNVEAIFYPALYMLHKVLYFQTEREYP
ncbi:MAG: hypothetical protein BWY31_02957 [Lentisphaerae bacterium ADurb.Bin242]|nr:MAG: hypothetical protein BWY31_02957 [Lentisphaerae bacterium ADurb.Bin242]